MAFRRDLMTRHTLDVVKGWFQPAALDFAAKFSANVTIDPVYSGRVVHLNDQGEFEMGIPDVVKSLRMPMFLFPTSDDPDVSNPSFDVQTDPDVWIPVAPTGVAMAFPATGAYEMESTEFEPVATAGVYNPGQGLTATADNANAVTGGRLTKGIAYEVPIVGIVSRGVFQNSHRRNVVAFWPYFLPRSA